MSGNGVAGREILHSLNSEPKFIITKRTSAALSWVCYHADTGVDHTLFLDTDQPKGSNTVYLASVSSNNFTVGSNPGLLNKDGEEQVAYLFADTPGLIKCGSWVNPGSGDGYSKIEIDCGFKPGWVMTKNTTKLNSTSTSDWQITCTPIAPVALAANLSNNEAVRNVTLLDNGFEINGDNGDTYIYIAIADPTTTAYYDEVNSRAVSQHELVRRFGVDADSTNLRNQGIYPLVNQPTGATEAFVKEGDAYRAIPNRSMEVFQAQQEAAEANERLDDANEALETLRVGFEARIAALEAGY